MKKLILYGILLCPLIAQSQNSIRGILKDNDTENPVVGVSIHLENTQFTTISKDNGSFILETIPNGNYILTFSYSGYTSQRFSLNITNKKIDLETVFLVKDIVKIFENQHIVITEDELNSDNSSSEMVSGLLQATRDVYLKTTAFQFSVSFFNRRGLASENGKVLLNGIEMNKLSTGRPQWSHWGGLNDITRNQEFSNGLSSSPYSFGDLLGVTNIRLRASEQRSGVRLTYTSSNRSYRNRFVATYNSGVLKKNHSFSLSISKRSGDEGFKDASSYHAISLFAGYDLKIDKKNHLNFSFIYAPNERGKTSPNTQEVVDLKGIRYNEYWGNQNNRKRNSRIKKVVEPIMMMNYDWNISKKTTFSFNSAYQFGYTGNTRLEYTFASNPSPTYYQNLPSYAVAQNDLENAYTSLQNFKKNGQIDWRAIYDANLTNASVGKGAAYIISEDRNDDKQLSTNLIISSQIHKNISINSKISYKNLISENYALVKDVLGGIGYLDFDKFGNTPDAQQNDLQNPNRIAGLNQRFKYNYYLFSKQLTAFLQTVFNYKKIDFFIAANFMKTTHQREGIYENGSFPGNLSLGKSDQAVFNTFRLKGGATYKITGRHFIKFNAGSFLKPPSTKNIYSNVRENNKLVEDLKNEKNIVADLSYLFRGTKINLKLTGYYASITNATKISFFYADGIAGNGSENTAFVQEILTNIDKKHLGVEWGFEVKLTPTLQLHIAGNIGEYVYANNPDLQLTSDNFLDTFRFKKTSYLKNYKLSNGPQTAYTIGFEYRDAKYWWLALNTNFFQNTFISVAPINRTENFGLDIDGIPFNNFNPATASTLLEQEKFDHYMVVNLVCGKSFKIKNTYIGMFASVQNLFNKTYKTGGFEQSRNANYQTLLEDQKNEIPVFGNKYWYGKGTTYFLNLNISL